MQRNSHTPAKDSDAEGWVPMFDIVIFRITIRPTSLPRGFLLSDLGLLDVREEMFCCAYGARLTASATILGSYERRNTSMMVSASTR